LLQLTIADDGRGFDAAHQADGHGLASMRARAAALSGTLELVSAPNSGATIKLIAPLTPRKRLWGML
jgi:signal transduction histidine kinase